MTDAIDPVLHNIWLQIRQTVQKSVPQACCDDGCYHRVNVDGVRHDAMLAALDDLDPVTRKALGREYPEMRTAIRELEKRRATVAVQLPQR